MVKYYHIQEIQISYLFLVFYAQFNYLRLFFFQFFRFHLNYYFILLKFINLKIFKSFLNI